MDDMVQKGVFPILIQVKSLIIFFKSYLIPIIVSMNYSAFSSVNSRYLVNLS